MPRRDQLPPQKALDLATIYLEQAHKTNDPVLALEICLDAENALYRIQQSDQKLLVKASTSNTDNANKALCKAIAATLNDVGALFDNLGHPDHSKRGYKHAAKWGHPQQLNPAPSNPHTYCRASNAAKDDNEGGGNDGNDDANSSSKTQSNSRTVQESVSTIGSKVDNINNALKSLLIHSSVIVPKEIFSQDVPQVIFKYNLPHPDTPLNNTQQLAYCLGLLPTAPIPRKDLSKQEQEWSLATSDDHDEQERLCNLASDVITMFIHDDIKSEAIVTEVVMLAPVLDYDQYRTLLMALVNGIKQNIMLETHLLEGLTQLVQHVPPRYLDPYDLVHILSTLSSCLQGTHEQSGSHIYQLCVTVSHVLDAMVDNQVKGLNREQLHEPLSAYLKVLKDSSDPFLVYHAAYASQALLYIPNDETIMQAMLRRTSAVAQGVFGAVSAVKDWDLNAFMDELSNVQRGLPSVADAIDKSLRMYKGATSIYTSGEAFKHSVEEGLAFSHKSAWYPALRRADAFLQSGELTKFKTLICEAPCRRDVAFQWGICLRLREIAASTEWIMKARQDAVSFLGEIYKNDRDWGGHVEIKQWVINILKSLVSLSSEHLQVAESLLTDLAMDGDTNKQQLYMNCFNEPLAKYPFITTPPSPASPSLLDHVQNKPDVEKSLRLLKRQRMETGDDRGFYVQQYAKASPQASDDDLFLLMDK
ncbi:hypothetical protein BX616_002164, partial [Lobosporangium transversale]